MIVDPKKQLVEYLRKNIAKGYTLESLKIALTKQGYSITTIERAIDALNKEMSKKAPVFKEKPLIRHEIIDDKDSAINIKKSWWRDLFS